MSKGIEALKSLISTLFNEVNNNDSGNIEGYESLSNCGVN